MADEEDLYTVSIIFWVFRTYSHYISSGKEVSRNVWDYVFWSLIQMYNKLIPFGQQMYSKDSKGAMETSKNLLLEMPRVYVEFVWSCASGDDKRLYILEETLSFTSRHLESIAASVTCPPHLSVYIRSALGLAQHWNMDMLVPEEVIPFYEQEKDHDEMLLKFAKLSFKFLQLQHLQEHKSVTKYVATHTSFYIRSSYRF